MTPTLLVVACALTSTLASDASWFRKPGGAVMDVDRIRAASLLKKGRSLRDAEKATALLESCLKRRPEPEDPKLCLECAVAYNAVMRIKTNSNTLHITRMLDTPENKRVWKQLGPRSLELATIAKRGRPRDPEALVAFADAYFFANAVKGVLAAATTGSGLKFKGNSKELIAKCPRADGGIGHAYLGAFFLMAPWPMANARLAEEHLSAAHRLVASRRNAYYLGVMHYRLGRPEKAAERFREAIKAKCASASEQDFGDWMVAEAKLALGACAKASS